MMNTNRCLENSGTLVFCATIFPTLIFPSLFEVSHQTLRQTFLDICCVYSEFMYMKIIWWLETVYIDGLVPYTELQILYMAGVIIQNMMIKMTNNPQFIEKKYCYRFRFSASVSGMLSSIGWKLPNV